MFYVHPRHAFGVFTSLPSPRSIKLEQHHACNDFLPCFSLYDRSRTRLSPEDHHRTWNELLRVGNLVRSSAFLRIARRSCGSRSCQSCASRPGSAGRRQRRRMPQTRPTPRLTPGPGTRCALSFSRAMLSENRG